MTQTKIDWVRESSSTYENVTLSAHMMNLAVKNGIGFHSEAQEIKAKHIGLLKEYTGAEQLTAIKQLFVVFQIATLSAKHQFPYGFIIWAPKIMHPPLMLGCSDLASYSCCFLMSLINRFALER